MLRSPWTLVTAWIALFAFAFFNPPSVFIVIWLAIAALVIWLAVRHNSRALRAGVAEAAPLDAALPPTIPAVTGVALASHNAGGPNGSVDCGGSGDGGGGSCGP
jgi:hypothetical protein